MTPAEEDFQRSWNELIREAQFAPRERPFESLQDDLLAMMEGFDISGLPGRIPPGIYRQKGNRFKDLIGTIIRRKCNHNFIERNIEGLTDRRTDTRSTSYSLLKVLRRLPLRSRWQEDQNTSMRRA